MAERTPHGLDPPIPLAPIEGLAAFPPRELPRDKHLQPWDVLFHGWPNLINTEPPFPGYWRRDDPYYSELGTHVVFNLYRTGFRVNCPVGWLRRAAEFCNGDTSRFMYGMAREFERKTREPSILIFEELQGIINNPGYLDKDEVPVWVFQEYTRHFVDHGSFAELAKEKGLDADKITKHYHDEKTNQVDGVLWEWKYDVGDVERALEQVQRAGLI